MDSYAATERFHLLFLGQLTKKVGQNLLALKGGCNLRFYFKSVRYSEDIDFDVHTISVETLRKNVRQVLKSSSFNDTLRAAGIEIAATSEPKQTDTTQRWKLSLKLSGFDREIPTKIEFSRRDEIAGAIMESVDPDIIVKYMLYPIHACHYSRLAAINQKIGALIGRANTQARDIFDLSLLIHDGLDLRGYALSSSEIEKACEHAQSLTFDDYRSQVVAYLMPEHQSQYGTPKVWNEMVFRAVNFARKVGDESSRG